MQGKSKALFQRCVSSESNIDYNDDFDICPENNSDIEEILNGYIECMVEAVRYLTDVERFPPDHPTVHAMKMHLMRCKQWLLSGIHQ